MHWRGWSSSRDRTGSCREPRGSSQQVAYAKGSLATIDRSSRLWHIRRWPGRTHVRGHATALVLGRVRAAQSRPSRAVCPRAAKLRCQRRSGLRPTDVTVVPFPVKRPGGTGFGHAFKVKALRLNEWLLWEKPDRTWAWKLIRLDGGRAGRRDRETSGCLPRQLACPSRRCLRPAQIRCSWRRPMRATSGRSSLSMPRGSRSPDHRILVPSGTGSNVRVY
jgi:hypothetical protein